jgi:hypothetical protein
MAGELSEIINRLKKIERHVEKEGARSTGGGFPNLEVYFAAKSACRARPALHRSQSSIPVIGRGKHLQRSVYGKVFEWLGIAPVNVDEAAPNAPLALMWAPKILGGEYDFDGIITRFRRTCPSARIVNENFRTDDKQYCQEVFAECFGYSLAVAPETHVGPMVEKGRVNARHDGRVVQGPLPAASPDLVYQRLIDNTVKGNLVEDIRIVIVNYIPIYAYLKYRSESSRFSNGNVYARLAGVFDVCSDQEIAALKRLTKSLALEIGELDALRDRTTGALYVVDVNNTPFGPPNGIEARDGDIAVRWLSDAFGRAYCGLGGAMAEA